MAISSPKAPTVRRSRVVLVALILCLAGVGGYRLAGRLKARPTAPAAEQSGGLTVPPERLDFGEAWEQKAFAWVLPIHNRQRHDTRIREFAPSCSCTQVDPPSLVIPAGETREVRLTLDLRDRGKREKYTSGGGNVFEVRVAPRLEVEGGVVPTRGWTVRGLVRPVVQFDPSAVVFGRHSVLALPLPAVKVWATSSIPLDRLTPATTSAGFRIDVRQVPDNRSRFELTVTQAGKLGLGAFDSDLVFTLRSSDGQQLPDQVLPAMGWICPDLEASPPDVVFGARKVGEVAETTVTLPSMTGKRVEALSFRAVGKGLDVERMREAVAGSPSFSVKQRIMELGAQAGAIFVRVRSQDQDEIEVRIAVSYHGLDPKRE